MNQKDRYIFKEFSEQIHKHFPKARIIAFGSRVRGNETWESDLDICVVSEYTEPEISDKIRHIAWEVGFENDRIISTIILNTYQFEHGPMSESTLVRNINQYGIAA